MLACIALLTTPLAVAPTALAVVPPLTVGHEAWVAVSVATLWHTPVSATPVTEISFGTRLPRVGVTGGWVRVATPTGRVLRLAASAVAVRAPCAAALPRTGSSVQTIAMSTPSCARELVGARRHIG